MLSGTRVREVLQFRALKGVVMFRTEVVALYLVRAW